MKMMLKIRYCLPIMTACAAAPGAFGAAPEIRTVDALPAGDEVRIAVELTAPVTPTIQAVSNPSRLIIYFPGVALGQQERAIAIGTNGVGEVQVRPSQATAQGALLTVGIDSVHPYGVEASGNKFVLHILPHQGQEVSGAAAKSPGDVKSVPEIGAGRAGEAPKPIGKDRTRDEGDVGDQRQPGETLMAFSRGAPPEVEHLALRSVVEGPRANRRPRRDAVFESSSSRGERPISMEDRTPDCKRG